MKWAGVSKLTQAENAEMTNLKHINRTNILVKIEKN